MVLTHEFNRKPDDMEFLCLFCGDAFTKLDLGAHIDAIITDTSFRDIKMEGEICMECLLKLWDIADGGLDGARRRMNLKINLTKQAIQGKYDPWKSTNE